MLCLSYLAADGNVHKIETKNLQLDSTEHSPGELGEGEGEGHGKIQCVLKFGSRGFQSCDERGS